ncbi:GntR family transcriptional regulator [Trinickia dabaoshanensis]|uniref:GntR family transcriptional regulator n=1 Tax=Trinickia dabaoshanensis TaxID=564714 RepID=A0A2N7VEW5_9BURK|nr:GntR family transcriptional regulator [Trinickia dabaoshanensis]PMS15697.1 GntR family transcriptional regulator [Trinickia dabaoshanensis]
MHLADLSLPAANEAPECATPTALGGPSPLYSQIAEILRGRILQHVYRPNQQMPSESELMSAFDVSRITVRQALGNLQSEGLIFRIHGKGTFVSRPRAFQDLGSLQGFGSAMREMGYEAHSKVLSVRTIAPPKHVRDRIESGDRVTELKRLRFLNRAPISLDVSYLPSAIGVRVARADLANRDVFAVLENDLQIALGHADLRMCATPATEELRDALAVDEGSPVLFIERVIHTSAGAPIEYEELYYRGDAFQFKVRVARQAVAAKR